jgi:hypothetical protein
MKINDKQGGRISTFFVLLRQEFNYNPFINYQYPKIVNNKFLSLFIYSISDVEYIKKESGERERERRERKKRLKNVRRCLNLIHT